jgi:hypothetical protein
LKSGSVARAEREKGGQGQRGRVRVEVTEGGEGGPGVTVVNVGRLAIVPDRQARVAPLPREQRRAASVGDAGEGG